MKKIILSLFLLVAISCITFGQNNSVELLPIADSYVYSGDNIGNYGKDNKLRVLRTNRSTVLRHAFLRFDISSISTSIPGKVYLKLYCNEVDDASAGLSLEVAETPADWNEEDIKWSNAPKPTKVVGKLDVNVQKNYIEIDLTAYIKEAVTAGAKQISLRISDPKSTGIKSEFGSKESKNPPMLVVQ
ncbi:DNRLRE domain-containing protein [Parapedobacter sp. SGR-10]|uniref:CBM96 family carbohydrate-binding protein n=1 Tax=Parapedobacter sp. SGR-10 TaxID=2710879 RepID=UPI0013D26E34|nr:DNRLRE domain-containing protein [Parapedobacter sp. SGR-10]NGF55841.1 DNRLRE domain-containing protein [Parapedobacter sp. SGR-10]